jgi:hypothetical protein
VEYSDPVREIQKLCKLVADKVATYRQALNSGIPGLWYDGIPPVHGGRRYYWREKSKKEEGTAALLFRLVDVRESTGAMALSAVDTLYIFWIRAEEWEWAYDPEENYETHF